MKVAVKTLFKNTDLTKALPWILIVAGVIGLLCSLNLTIDKMEILKDPHYKAICDINPVISCGSVMNSKQAELFGFDNSFLGLSAFTVLITTGFTLLAGAKLKRWYWSGLQKGTMLGVIFVHWLIYNSLFRIHSLCPFCMVIWTITITTFWYVTLYNIQERHLVLHGRLAKAASFARRHHADIIILWFLIILGLILKQFWYYYGPKLGF